MTNQTGHRSGIGVPAAASCPVREDWSTEQPKPLWRGWLHLVWFNLSLVGGTVLIIAAQGVTAVTTMAVYGGSVTALFGASALYHRVNWPFTANRIMQRVDHLMIFVLIAGTATPMCLLAAPGLYGRICLILTWALAALAAGLHLVWMDAPERLIGGVYIGLGAVAGLALPPVWRHAGPVAGCLVIAGGLLYVIGALGYHVRWPNPSPSVFGYHEVFHAFVCAAATCHFVAVATILW